jgi:hypothetical protein
VAVVHQDDVLSPGHLAAHVRAFQGDTRVGLVASASGVIDGAGTPVPESVVGRGGLGPSDRTFAPGEALPLLAEGNPLRCSAVSIRAEAHASVNGFDPSLRYVVDWDLWARVSLDWSLTWLAADTVDVRWHPASETHRFKTGTADLEESQRVLNGLLDRLGERFGPGAVPPVARSATRRLARAYLNRAHDALNGGDAPLARACSRQALRLSPGVVRAVVTDPRLAARLAAAWVAPGLGRRRHRGPAPPA